jgi:hypothetical protein
MTSLVNELPVFLVNVAHINLQFSLRILLNYISLSRLRLTTQSSIQLNIFTMAPVNRQKKQELASKLALRSRPRPVEPAKLPCLRCAKQEGLCKADSDEIPSLDMKCDKV